MWQHVHLSEQIRPWDTLACCWDVKQASNQQLSRPTGSAHQRQTTWLTVELYSAIKASDAAVQWRHDEQWRHARRCCLLVADEGSQQEVMSRIAQTIGALTCYQWGSGEQNQTSHWALWRSSHHCEETLTELVWAQNKMNRICKDDPIGHCTRREKERQTEIAMGRQRNGMDRIKVGWSPSKGRK